MYRIFKTTVKYVLLAIMLIVGLTIYNWHPSLSGAICGTVVVYTELEIVGDLLDKSLTVRQLTTRKQVRTLVYAGLSMLLMSFFMIFPAYKYDQFLPAAFFILCLTFGSTAVPLVFIYHNWSEETDKIASPYRSNDQNYP